ncbi:hypothetical protein BD779DRAFT_1669574 [Infundibulicybe gibba]|nr:hypothetical protein BD779DRAFT_1669574 [Infundibulicybe gibba]
MSLVKLEATPPTHALARAVGSSEAASLKGQKAKTPIIAGSICGGVMGLAWIIGFAIYFTKRYRRKKLNRLVAAGKVPPETKEKKLPQEKIIIPPDPAILLGQRLPGEKAFSPEPRSSSGDGKASRDHRPERPHVKEAARISDVMTVPSQV